ncbi:MAG: S8 family serine peptidase [Hyphomicrobiaceae bacterium]
MTADSASNPSFKISNRPEFETPAPVHTGAYILVFDDDVKPTVAERKIRKATGIRSAQSKDFDSDSEFITKAFAETNAAVFTRLGLAVIRPDDECDLAASMAAMKEDGDVVEYLPEFYLFTNEDLQRQYADWVRNGLRILADISTQDPQLLQLPPPEATESDVELIPRAAAAGMTWGLEAIGVPRTRYDGDGIRLCILDTGLDLDHVDFLGRAVHAASFISGETAQDGNGHGTHVAGTAAGPVAPESGVIRYGVASASELFVGKVLSNSGSGSESTVIAGIEWALENRCDIISMSLGRPTAIGEQPMRRYERLGKAALDEGALIISSGGNASSRNFGYIAPVGSPANASTIMAVAAVNEDMHVANFSCGGLNPNGGEVNICAPGVDAFSSWIMPRRHHRISGTSMACPHVSGTAALFAQSDPALRGRALWEKLEATAKHIGLNRRDGGAGLVQVP